MLERSDFKTTTDSLNEKFRKSLKSIEYALTEFSERFLKFMLYDAHSFIKAFNSIFICITSFPSAWILPEQKTLNNLLTDQRKKWIRRLTQKKEIL